MAEKREEAKILWDFLRLGQPLEKSDVIIGLGCTDIQVAEKSAELFLEGWAPLLLFTGKQGAGTKDKWTKPEAEVFQKVALEKEVPRENILLETEATNTGENIRFSCKLLKERNIPVSSVILVQTPIMERRVYATFERQWSKEGGLPKAIVTSPQVAFDEYFDKDATKFIESMLETLYRIKSYPEKGYQEEQEIPRRVQSAFEWFCCAGYKFKK
ncbi:uncharacterized protein SCO4629-like [Xyrichtys novacula]|uniref:Uncharacterized protein SCO4629-like n=1 Tax=Xyrichtys novacula TaxID=13765 RepID=A0AAV1HG28_XYRNO|nr:uncharacterized protein SCO4629-like [Xyrichtys novacula]